MENDYQQKVAARRLFWSQYAKDLTQCARALLRAGTLATADGFDPGRLGRGHSNDIKYILQEVTYDLEHLDEKLSHLAPIYPQKKEGDE